MLTRVLYALIGVWLFFSAFVWTHGTAQFTNTWIVGVLVTLCGIAWILGVRSARYVGVALAFWLFVSSVFLPRLAGGAWAHNVIMAALLIVTALFPTAGERRRAVHTHVAR